ncbi:unnamed protein product [Symbiodinium sp. CCMP2456]|nr:unnamed protein product [Symbiodinium sp. CCMP2456]
MANATRRILFLACVILHHPDAADAGSSGSAAAAAVWQRLTELVQRPAEAQDEAIYWSQALTTLHSEHPHPDVSGVLAWLYLFGLPSTTQPLVQRDVNAAIRIAREGIHHTPPCARCYALLGLLLGVGYPPLVGAAHLAQDGIGEPRLLILGDVLAQEPATADAARLPRDIGPPDPSAAAYALSYAGGDPLGMLAVAYLNRTRMINLTKMTAPGPNQASSLVSRMPKTVDKASCDETLVNSLGNLAASTIDEIQSGSWGPVPDPLSQGLSQQRADKAFLEHILADTSRSSASDLAKASSMLETGGFRSEELPAVARKAANVSQLRSLAASKGDRKSALWLAVEHLQENDTQKAKPLLDMVVTKAAQDADHDADAEMAKYYLARFASPNSSDVAIARRDAWPHLVQAADLGREDAKLLVAHAFVDGSDDLQTPEGSSSNTEAIRRYKQLLPEASGKSDKPNVTFPASSAPSRRNGALNPVQAFAAYNLGVLSLKDSEGGSSASPVPSELPSASGGICSPEVQGSFLEVVLSQSGIVRLIIALGRRSARLGDEIGALLLAMLLSDIGHDLGHADAAFLWDKWAAHQPPHLVLISDVQTHDNKQAHHPCNLRGWWTTSSPDLVSRNVSLVYAADVMGGGTEMFNASLADSHLLHGLEATDIVQPIPERTEFRHLYSFLWHTSYDAFPAGAPVPVALQPPGAVPHLLEFHHQRGKLLMDKSCNTAVVEGMYVNWTFHRLDAEPAPEVDVPEVEANRQEPLSNPVLVSTRDFLHCWVRPEWYHRSLQANVAAQKTQASPGTWEELLSLTVSADCPCYGGFGCRRGDGACEDLARQWAGAGEEHSACRPGSFLCREVPPELEPARPIFAAAPDTCAFYFHRRAAYDGKVDAMHVLSHAYSSGYRGAPKDGAQAFYWSQQAMATGDLRGRFDVAYSMENGFGTEKDPDRAYELYQEILTAQGLGKGEDLAARAASFLALLAASGRAWAGRFFRAG